MTALARIRLSLALCVAASWPEPALASTSFPAQVKASLHLATVPACTLCHVSDAGGDGTAIRPFGVTVVRLGALGNENLPSLTSALTSVERERTDSDEDGISDAVELRQGTDPNRGAPGARELPTPMTGCALAMRSLDTNAFVASLACAAALALAARRRRA
jgi:hypothetical protein